MSETEQAVPTDTHVGRNDLTPPRFTAVGAQMAPLVSAARPLGLEAEPSDAQRAEIYREAARFLQSPGNPRYGDQSMARVGYTMDEAGYELFQQAKRFDATGGVR